MKLIKIFSIFALLIFTVGACTEIVEIELEENSKPELMVEGHISTAVKQHQVRLSYTSDYFSNTKNPPVNGAIVTISDGEQSFLLTEKDNSGYYYTDIVRGETGKTYTLDIILDNGKQYSASSLLTPMYDIDSIRFSNIFYHPWYEGYGYNVYMYVQEKKGKGDAYLFDLYLDQQLVSDTLRDRNFVNDSEVEGQYIHDWDVFWINNNDLLNDSTHVKVTVESIPQKYYTYLLETMLETDWRGGMYDGPPANPLGNISNGGLGYFYACDLKSYERKIKKEISPDDPK